MSVYQSDYFDAEPKGIVGALADETEHLAVSATVWVFEGIRFGAPAAHGPVEDTAIPYVVGGRFLGLAIETGAIPAQHISTPALIDGFPRDFTGSFMTKGVMFVESGSPIAIKDPAYYNTVTRQYLSAAGANTVGPIPFAQFRTAATAAGQTVELVLRQ